MEKSSTLVCRCMILQLRSVDAIMGIAYVEMREESELPIPQGHAYLPPKSICCCLHHLSLQEEEPRNYIYLLSWLTVPIRHTLVPSNPCRRNHIPKDQYKHVVTDKANCN